ncbi:MAG: DUF4781 domain-containing protein [Hyphomicrobiales bacterium]|nr:DUF4781 domain-containing protein [Hyphomicrobiales bacterium]
MTSPSSVVDTGPSIAQTTNTDTQEVVTAPPQAKGVVGQEGGWLPPQTMSYDVTQNECLSDTDTTCQSAEDLWSEERYNPSYPTRFHLAQSFPEDALTSFPEVDRTRESDPVDLANPSTSETLASQTQYIEDLTVEQAKAQLAEIYAKRQAILAQKPENLPLEQATPLLAELMALNIQMGEAERALANAIENELETAALDVFTGPYDPDIGPGPINPEYLSPVEAPFFSVPGFLDSGKIFSPYGLTPDDKYASDYQLDAAVAELKTDQRFKGLEQALDEARARLQLKREIDRPVDIHPELIEDPVSNAFVHAAKSAANLNYAHLDRGDNHIQYDLAYRNPVIAMLLLGSNIEIETTSQRLIKATANGVEIALGEAHQTLAAAKQHTVLGAKILQAAADQGLLQFAPEVQNLLAVLPGLRLEYTQDQVVDLLSKGRDVEAVKVLGANMNATQSPQERQVMWMTAGQPHFNGAYFEKKIDEALAHTAEQAGLDNHKAGVKADNVGRWVQDFISNGAPPSEVGNILLDKVKSEFSQDWYTSLDPDEDVFEKRWLIDQRSGLNNSFYMRDEKAVDFTGGLIKLVEVTDIGPNKRAGEIAQWLLSSPTGAPIHALGEKITGQLTTHMNNSVPVAPYAMPTASTYRSGGTAFETMPLSPLSQKVFKHQLEMFGKGSLAYEGLTEDLQGITQDFLSDQSKMIAAQLYQTLSDNPDAAVRPYFTSFMSGPDVTERKQYSGIELRNYIGRAMGMSPTNVEAAKVSDNTKDWFSGPELSKAINVVEAWITEFGGTSAPELSAIPMVYADPKQGVLNLTLFQVHTPNGTIVIDSSMANIVLNGPEAASYQLGDKPNGPLIYDDFDAFIRENRLSTDGTLYVPARTSAPDGFSFVNDNGELQYQPVQAAITTTGEQVMYVVDWGAAVGGVVVGGVMVVGGIIGTPFTVGQSAWISVAGVSLMGYGLGRTGYELYEMNHHAQSMSFSNPEARMQYLSLIAMAGGLATSKAASLGRVAAQSGQVLEREAILLHTAGKTGKTFETLVLQANQHLARAQTLKNTAYGLSAIDIGASGWAMGEQGYYLVQNWESLEPGQRAEALTMLGLNVVPFGVGIATFRNQFTVDPNLVEAKAQAGFRERNIAPPDPGAKTTNTHERIIIPEAGYQNRIVTPDGETTTASGIVLPKETGAGTTEGGIILPDGVEGYKLTSTGLYVRDNGVVDGVIPTQQDGVPRFNAETLGLDSSIGRSIEIDEASFWPNYAEGNVGPKSRYRSAQAARWIGGIYDRTFPSLNETYTPQVYARLLSEADPKLQAILPKPEDMTVDINTIERSFTPPGLEKTAHDIHFHPYPYDRRDMSWAGPHALLTVTPDRGRILLGCIPQHCGAGPHYSTFNPGELTLKDARLLDQRLAETFIQFAQQNPRHAARIDLSLTGVGDPVTKGAGPYLRDQLLKYPGLFTSVGEITANKEMVSIMLGGQRMTLDGDPYAGVLDVARETGIMVLLHSDWSKHALDPEGRPTATKSAYEASHFETLIQAHEEQNLRGVNVVFAHTGIGRFVRPNDAPITRDVKIVKWDFNTGKEISSKTVSLTAPEHIHKMYQLIERVPNARFDMSWSDVSQAYMDSPTLRRAFVDFIVANPDRILFGSDSVKPVNDGHYHQTLKLVEPLLADVALQSPNALWKVLRGNYENVMHNAGHRVRVWTEGQLRDKPGSAEKIHEMRDREAMLITIRRGMNREAVEEYAHWLHDLQNLWEKHSGIELGYNLQQKFHDERKFSGADPEEQTALQEIISLAEQQKAGETGGSPNSGVEARLFENLPKSEPQTWETTARVGTGTPAGFDGEPTNPVRQNAQQNAAFLGGLSAWIATVLPIGILGRANPAPGGDGVVLSSADRVANDGAFGIRGISALVKTLYAEKLRVDWEEIFEEGHVTRSNLNRFVSRIFNAQMAMGFSDEQMLQVGAVTEQFYKNYEYLRNSDAYNSRERFLDIMALVGQYQITVDRIIGGQASSLSAFDPRRGVGQAQRAINLATLLINDAVAVSWLASNGIDLSSPERAAQSSAAVLFGIGNGILTAHTATGLGGGLRGVDLESSQTMRWLQGLSTATLAAGGTAWAATDGIKTLEAFSAGQYDAAALHMFHTILDVAFTAGTFQSAKEQMNSLLSGMKARRPEEINYWIAVMAGALILREATQLALDATEDDADSTSDK